MVKNVLCIKFENLNDLLIVTYFTLDVISYYVISAVTEVRTML